MTQNNPTPQAPLSRRDQIGADLREFFRNVMNGVRYSLLVKSMINTLGYGTYTKIGSASPLLRVLENAKKPRIIAQPEMAKRLRKNMGVIGRFIGYKIVDEMYAREGSISAMDFSVINDWKTRHPVPPPPHAK